MSRVLLKPDKLERNAKQVADRFYDEEHNMPIKIAKKFDKKIDYSDLERDDEDAKESSSASLRVKEENDLDIISQVMRRKSEALESVRPLELALIEKLNQKAN